MSNEEFGAYVRLFLQSWDAHPVGYIPSDDVQLARLARSRSDEWARVKTAVLSRFKLDGKGRMYQKRLLETYQALRRKHKAKSAVAKHAAKARWEKEKHANALRMQSDPDAIGKEKVNSSLSPPTGANEPDPVVVQVRHYFQAPGQPLIWNQKDQDRLVELVKLMGWPWCEKAIPGRLSEGDGTPIETLFNREVKGDRKNGRPNHGTKSKSLPTKTVVYGER
jgi:uncharacterized protein YdaU (DUF1376 family)